MTVHGITTTKANLWIHFHPLEITGNKPCPALYLYDVEHCRDYIARHKPAVAFGRSKDPDRTISATGYLIPKNCLFITRQIVPFRYASDWDNLTDREAGLRGERAVRLLIFKNEIWLPNRQLRRLKDRADQLDGCDFELIIDPVWRIEIKTERVRSSNLFVQSHEQGHQPNFTPDGSEIVTNLDGFGTT